MATHELKIAMQYMIEVENGAKTFEIRKDDRGFQEFDTLELRCWDEGRYIGRTAVCLVTYVLRDFVGLKKGYVALGIKVMSVGWDEVDA